MDLPVRQDRRTGVKGPAQSQGPDAAQQGNIQKWAGRDGWDRHREVIAEMYRVKGYSVKRIQEVLKERYNVQATIRMIRYHLSRWGLDKKLKEKDVIEMTKIYLQRQREGKETIFELRDSKVTPEDLERYWRRKQKRLDELAELAELTPRPPNELRCYTPLPPLITSPNRILIPEKILRALRDYYAGPIRDDNWAGDGHGPNVCVKTEVQSWSMLYRFSETCHVACDLFEEGHFDEGGRLLISGTADLANIIRNQNPGTLHVVLTCMKYFYSKGRPEVMQLILKQMVHLAKLMFQGGHPLLEILQPLSTLSSTDLVPVARQVMTDTYGKKLSSMNKTAVRFRGGYLFHNLFPADHQEGLSQMRQLCVDCSNQFGAEDPVTIDIHFYLLRCLFLTNNYAQAGHIARRLVDVMTLEAQSDFPLQYSTSLRYLSWCEKQQGMRDMSELHIREAIEHSTRTMGFKSQPTYVCLSILEEWLREWGDETAAEVVQAQKLQAAGAPTIKH